MQKERVKKEQKKSWTISSFSLWSGTESNRRHGDFQSPALPTELPDRLNIHSYKSRPFSVNKISYLAIVFCLLYSTSLYCAQHDYQYYEEKGILQYKELMYEFAEEHLQRALALNPKAYKSSKYLALLAYKDGKSRIALTYALQSLKGNNQQDDMHYLVGEIYDHYDQREKATKHFLDALSFNGKNYMAHIGLARHLSLRGDSIAANKHFQIAFSINEAATTALTIEAELMRETKNRASAITILEHILQINPASYDVYFELSSLYRETQQYRKAIATLERIKYYCPTKSQSYIHIANIYYSKKVLATRHKDYLAAIYNVEQALMIDPENLRYLALAEQLYKITEQWEMYEETRKKVNAGHLRDFE